MIVPFPLDPISMFTDAANVVEQGELDGVATVTKIATVRTEVEGRAMAIRKWNDLFEAQNRKAAS